EDYRPFGDTQSSSGATTSRQYNGRVHDQGTGLYYYGARYYDPAIGRFISADTATGGQGDLQSQNRYAYVMNNPYKYVDPTGRQPQGPAAPKPVPSYVYAYMEVMKNAGESIELQLGATLHLITKGKLSIAAGATLAGIGMLIMPG